MKHRKTESGKQAFKGSNVALSVAQRSALIMFDGVKDDAVILQSLAMMGLSAQDIDFLKQSGLIEAVDGAQPAATTVAQAAAASSPASSLSEQELYQRAYPIATKLSSGLGLRGFRLNLSIESAANFKELLALAPKIQAAVGDGKYAELDRALKGQ